jgi:hypothetical protein
MLSSKMDKPKQWGIDGDVVVYRVGFASDKNEDSLEDTLAATKAALQSIINACGDEGTIYLTGANNFRFEETADCFEYKANRKDAGKPTFYKEIRSYMITEFGAEVQDGQEADDALAIAAVQHGHGIATIDKDLDGCPGYHYNWVKEQLYYVSEVEADRFFYTQMLTGDATDGIPGLFKMLGKKAMPKVKAPIQELETPIEMYAYVRSVYCAGYAEVGMCLDSMDEVVDRWLLKIGRALWMRREEGQLWDAP